jgi:hypothetical protein
MECENQVLKGLNVSLEETSIHYLQMYYAWQPSLELGRPARALNGPYSLQRQGSTLALWHSKHTKAKFGSFNKKKRP